jgi:NAD(P)-dependent dehydrogenase (short-subunit alcohol dehydrogenase family)
MFTTTAPSLTVAMSSQSMRLGPKAKTSMFWSELHSLFMVRPPLLPTNDLSGQVGIVTGGSSGLGFHCCRHLLSMGLSRLIFSARTMDEGALAASKLRNDFPAATVDLWTLELTSYSSIQEFGRRADAELTCLDFTILNAGAMLPDFKLCPTGHETVMQVNYLSTFYMAILMLPVAKAKSAGDKPGRISIVSSGTALFAQFQNKDERPFLASFDDTRAFPWNAAQRYFASKALGHLFFARLLEYLNPDDTIVNLVEPGMCKGTSLHREVKGVTSVFFESYKNLIGRAPELGAWTYVDAAVVKGRESHGCFLMDWEIHPYVTLYIGRASC